MKQPTNRLNQISCRFSQFCLTAIYKEICNVEVNKRVSEYQIKTNEIMFNFLSRSSDSNSSKETRVTDISEELYTKGITRSKNYTALVVDNFISKEECDKLIHLTETRGYEQALVNTGGGTQRLMPDVRSSDRCIIDDHEMAASLYAKAAKYAPQIYQERWERVGLNERLRFLRYDKGGYFKSHFDGTYERPDGKEKSFVTFFLFLNDECKGGCSTFVSPMKESVTYPCEPKAGRLIVFQHNILHRGSIVKSGRKYALRTDFMYRKIEE